MAVSKGSGDDTGRLNLSLRTGSQLTAALKYGLQEQAAAWGRVYIDGDLLCGEMPFSSKEADQNLEACRRLSKRSEVIIALPYVIRAKDTRYLDRVLHLLTEYPDVFAGVMARSLDEIGWFCSLERGNAWKCYGDAGLYVWNRETLKVWKETLDGFCLPLELKSQEQRCLTEGMIPCEKVIYGRIPMMITANCVVNTTLGCRRDQAEEATWLTDRYRKRFPVERNCTHCMNIIYNSVPLSLHGELAKWNKRADLRIDLTVEDERESGAVLTYFTGLQAAGYPRADAKPPFLEYTTGHERRGVE